MLTQTNVPDLTLVESPPDPDGARKPRRLSDILQEIADAPATPDERISLGDLIEGFGNRAFGALLFIFAVPVALPIAIPGISAVLGAPLLFLSWQLMRGREQPWLPEVMRSRSFRRVDFAKMLQRVLPLIRRVERLVGPRLIWLTNRRGEQVIGLFALALAVVLFLPIPFGNTVPALAIAILSLAVLERDGVAAIAGTLVGVAGVAVVSGVVVGLVKGATTLDEMVVRLAVERDVDIGRSMLSKWLRSRGFAWLSRNRRLAKDFEQTIASATAWLFIASIQLFTRRIARL